MHHFTSTIFILPPPPSPPPPYMGVRLSKLWGTPSFLKSWIHPSWNVKTKKPWYNFFVQIICNVWIGQFHINKIDILTGMYFILLTI